jgi:hypothetical protein
VPEYWIVDLGAEEILVMRGPSLTGYTHVTTVERDGVLTVAGLLDTPIAAGDIIGPAITGT